MYQDERKLDFRPIGKAIKKAREAKGWTQEQLGQMIDRDVRTVMYFENRGHHPRLEVFYKLMTIFDLSVDQFFYPTSENTNSDLRKQIELSLNSLSEKDLTILQGTIQAMLKAQELED